MLDISSRYGIKIVDYKSFELLLKMFSFYGDYSVYCFFEDLIKMSVLPCGFFRESDLLPILIENRDQRSMVTEKINENLTSKLKTVY